LSNFTNASHGNSMSDFESDVSSRSVRQVEECAEAFAKNKTIEIAEKIRALRLMARTLAEQVDELLPEPKAAHYLYKERPDRKMDPVTFLKTYYGKYLGALNLASIGKFDRYLYSELSRIKRENGGKIPGLNLLSNEEYSLEELTSFSQRQLESLDRLGTFYRRHRQK